MSVSQTVVKPLVVRVIETLLLQSPFQVPIDLRRLKKELRVSRANTRDGIEAKMIQAVDARVSSRKRQAESAWPYRSAHRRTSWRCALTALRLPRIVRNWRNSVAGCPASRRSRGPDHMRIQVVRLATTLWYSFAALAQIAPRRLAHSTRDADAPTDGPAPYGWARNPAASVSPVCRAACADALALNSHRSRNELDMTV